MWILRVTSHSKMRYLYWEIFAMQFYFYLIDNYPMDVTEHLIFFMTGNTFFTYDYR